MIYDVKCKQGCLHNSNYGTASLGLPFIYKGFFMKIQVKLFATLRVGRDKILDLELDKNNTIEDVIKQLKIDEKDIAILLKNGLDANISDILKDNDTISIFPPVGGG